MNHTIPVVPLRGLVILPGELLHFDAGREKSVSALQAAIQLQDGMIFLSSQHDARKNEVGVEDIFGVGTLCKIRQVLCLPGDSVRVLVEGVSRARLKELLSAEPYFIARVEELADSEYDENTAEALRRRLKKTFKEYAQYSMKYTADIIETIEAKAGHGEYADAIANSVMNKTEDRQRILEELNPVERLKAVLKHVSGEIEIQKIDRRISQEVKKQVDKNQRDFYLREQMKAIRKELSDNDESEADAYRARMEKKEFPAPVRTRLEKEIDRLAEMPGGSHEAPSMRNYIECMLDLPWTERTEDDLNIENARRILNENHFGMEKVKDRIIEHIAVSRLTGELNGQIICFAGPPGVGKTSICESIAAALGRKFVRMSLGGIRDEAELRGHRRTYIGAMPGRVIAAMRQAGTVNPVILFDEIDKLASDYHGDPASAMLEVLDSAQNFAFRDHFLELPYDLSKVMFITTANSKENIPRPLLDRMEVIDVPSYLETEKLEIAKRHLIPKQMKKHGIKKSMLTVPENVVSEMIRGYTAEAGVRELERTAASICRKAACEIGSGKEHVRMSKQKLYEYLGQPKYTQNLAERADAVGMANGLAWTSVGGTTLEVEAQVLKGSGQVQITGKLGEVMQESARAALTFIRAHADTLGIEQDFLSHNDIHVHVPEGAVPKDGPSAGVTMMTAMTSALTGIPVKAGVGMTGEITLRGRVLPIGGLREKLLAAVRAGMHTVIVPLENRKDMEEVPAEVKEKLRIVYASEAFTVLKTALSHMPAHTPRKHLNVTEVKSEGAHAMQ
ncbi:MAG: endopeptidase La [Clostridiaceae bacterium]